MESISDGVRARIALEKHGFRFQHTLGQNFLLDDERVARIVALSGVNEADDVLEIGPGAGVLTCALARRARRVVALEIDRALAPVLTEMLSGVSNVRLEFADALKVDLAALMGGRFAVVANLPYYITADMVMKLLKSGLDISHITIMVQKEAAARMKRDGLDNDVLERIAGDSAFPMGHEELTQLLDASAYVGRAPEQAETFILQEVDPILASAQAMAGMGEINV